MKWLKSLKNQPWFNIAIALIIAISFYYVLMHLRTIWKIAGSFMVVIRPLIIGGVIAYLVDPLVRLFENKIFKKMHRRGAARMISIVISIIIVLAIIAAIVWVIAPQLITSVQAFFSNIPNYATSLREYLVNFNDGFFLEYYDKLDFASFGRRGLEILTSFISGSNIISAGTNVASFLASIIISSILAVYYLASKKSIIRNARRISYIILKEKRYNYFIAFCTNCNSILVKYISCTVLEAIVVGVLNAIFMSILKMPYTAIISVIVGVANIIPTFGPIAGGFIGAFILIFINPLYALAFIIFTIVLQLIDGYIIKPKLYGDSLGVSPLLILVSIIVLGRLFGVIGVLLSIPIAAILQYLVKLYLAKRKDLKESQLIRKAKRDADLEAFFKPEPDSLKNVDLDEEDYTEDA